MRCRPFSTQTDSARLGPAGCSRGSKSGMGPAPADLRQLGDRGRHLDGDFVINQFLSSDQSTATIPMRLYSGLLVAPSPALNALATLLLLGVTIAVVISALILRQARRLEGARRIGGGRSRSPGSRFGETTKPGGRCEV
jgi:hypothetical protein